MIYEKVLDIVRKKGLEGTFMKEIEELQRKLPLIRNKDILASILAPKFGIDVKALYGIPKVRYKNRKFKLGDIGEDMREDTWRGVYRIQSEGLVLHKVGYQRDGTYYLSTIVSDGKTIMPVKFRFADKEEYVKASKEIQVGKWMEFYDAYVVLYSDGSLGLTTNTAPDVKDLDVEKLDLRTTKIKSLETPGIVLGLVLGFRASREVRICPVCNRNVSGDKCPICGSEPMLAHTGFITLGDESGFNDFVTSAIIETPKKNSLVLAYIESWDETPIVRSVIPLYGPEELVEEKPEVEERKEEEVKEEEVELRPEVVEEVEVEEVVEEEKIPKPTKPEVPVIALDDDLRMFEGISYKGKDVSEQFKDYKVLFKEDKVVVITPGAGKLEMDKSKFDKIKDRIMQLLQLGELDLDFLLSGMRLALKGMDEKVAVGVTLRALQSLILEGKVERKNLNFRLK